MAFLRRDPGLVTVCWVLIILLTILTFSISVEGCVIGDEANINNCTYGDTTDQSTCEASGCCFDTARTPNCFIYDTTIEGFQVSASVNVEEWTFSYFANSGSNILFLLDYGDNVSVSAMWSADAPPLTNIAYKYQRLGVYDAGMWYFNSLSFRFTPIEVCYSNNPEGSLLLQTPSYGTVLNRVANAICQLSGGYNLTLTIDWGDELSVFRQEYLSYVDVPANVSHTYSTTGTFTVNATLCSCECIGASANASVGAILSSVVCAESRIVALGENVTFDVSPIGGTEMTCIVDYGDGSPSVRYELPTGGALTPAHVYLYEGNYEMTTSCRDQENERRCNTPITVATSITNLTINATDEVRCQYATTVYFSVVVDGPASVLTAELAEISEYKELNVTKVSERSAVVTYYSAIVGKDVINMSATNGISTLTRSVLVNVVDDTISNVSFVGGDTFRVMIGQEVLMTAIAGTGYGISFDFDDGSDLFSITYASGTLSTSIIKTWPREGTYSLNVSAVNSINAVSTSATVIVANGIEADQLTVDVTNVSDVGSPVELTLRLNYTDNLPLSVELLCDFGDGQPPKNWAIEFVPSGSGANDSVFYPYQRDGFYAINCTLFNPVFRLPIQTSAIVGVPIVGLAISAPVPFVEVNRTVVFTIHVDSGSNVTYVVDTGDGNNITGLERSHANWNEPDDVQVPYAYSKAEKYVVQVTATNGFGPVSARTSFDVRCTIPELLLLTAPYHIAGHLIQFVLKYANANDYPPSKPVTCAWTFNGNESVGNWSGDELATSTDTTYGSPISVPGYYIATVVCSNSLSKVNASVEFVIEQQVKGLELTLPESPARNELVANLSMLGGTNVTYTISYGDGTPPELTTPPNDAPISIKHVYEEAGQFDISIFAENHISNESIEKTINVEIPFKREETLITVMDYETGVLNKTVKRDGRSSLFNLTVDIAVGSLVPSNGSISWSFIEGGTANSHNITSFPYTVVFAVASRQGDWLLYVACANDVSMEAFVIPVQVQVVPARPVLSVPTSPVLVTLPMELFQVTVANGSHFTITVDFGDGQTENNTVGNEVGPYTFDFSGYVYKIPGFYTVKAIVSNEFVHLVAEESILVLSELPNMTFITNSPVEFQLDGDLLISTFKLEIDKDDRLPINCTLNVDFGDGENLLTEASIGDDIEWTHVYRSTNYYNVRANVSLASVHKYFETVFSVQTPLSELKIKRNIPGQSEEQDVYFVGVVLQFSAVHKSGTGATYSWTITKNESGSVYHREVTDDRLMLLNMAEAGHFIIELIADNGLALRRSDVSVLEIRRNDVIRRFLYDATQIAGERSVYNLELSDRLDDSEYSSGDMCIKFRLGSDIYWISSAERNCLDPNDNDFDPESDQVTIQYPSLNYTVRHKFKTAGLIPVSVEVKDKRQTISAKASGVVNVTNYCFPPRIGVQADSQLISGYRSERISISIDNFRFEIRCTTTDRVYRMYSIRKYVNYTTGELGDDVTNDVNSVKTAVSLDIEPLQLDIGYYAVSLTLGMGSLDNPFPDLSSTQSLDLLVLPTNFRVTFQSGPYQQIQSPAKLRLVAQITNPDEPDDVDGYSFTWFCYRYEGESVWADEYVTLPIKAEIVDIPNDASRVDDSLGGCFNTGPGILSVKDNRSNVLLLNTTFMPVNTTYVIEVVVSKNGQSATDKTKIALYDKAYVDVDIRCLGVNCYDKAAVDSVYLSSSCNRCTVHDPQTFSWRVRRLDANRGRRKRDVTEFVIVEQRTESMILTISPDFLVDGSPYEVTLTAATASSEFTGKAYYEFTTDFSPRGGTCGSDLLKGDTLTLFTFSCVDWQDEGRSVNDAFLPKNNTPLKYSFSYFSADGVEHAMAGRSSYLPSGDPRDDYNVTVRAYVTDLYAYTVYYDFTVTVTPVDDLTKLTDKLTDLEETDITQIGLTLNQYLACLNAIANEINKVIESREDRGLFKGYDINDIYRPDGDTEEEIARQQDEFLLKVTDRVAKLYERILTSDEIVLPERELSAFAKSLASLTIPDKPLPSTVQTMFRITETLGNKILVSNVTLTDLLAVVEQREALQKTSEAISNTLVVASDILTHKEVTKQAFDAAVIDVSITEEDEARKLADLERRESAIVSVQSAAVPSVLSAMASVTLTMATATVTQSKIRTDSLTASVWRLYEGNDFTNRSLDAGSVGKINTAITVADQSFGGDIVIEAVVIDKSLFGIGTDEPTNGPVITFLMEMIRPGVPPKGVYGVRFTFSQTIGTNITAICSDVMVVDDDTGMAYISAELQNQSTYTMEMRPEMTTDTTVTIYLVTDCVNIIHCRPNKTNYNYKRTLPIRSQPNEWETSFSNLTGTIYVGIDMTGPNAFRGSNISFCMRSGASRCRNYNSKHKDWMLSGCSGSEHSVLGTPTCVCVSDQDSSAFTSDFTIPTVNPIDFKRIFANFAELLGDNPAVFATVCLVAVTYIVVAVWARREDRKDIEKWSALPLVGNLPHSRNFYKITVFTGIRRRSGTKSNICLILSGQLADSGKMELKDTRNRTFSTGSIRQFILATEQMLGDLIFIRIWHDSSGEGQYASWFLDKIIVEDLQTKHRYFFLCGRWLAVDEDDGQIDRVLPVAGRKDILCFHHMFFDKARRKLFDDHLWLSIIGRPSRSNFTRLQRLTCIVCLLFTTMLANAMWYGRVNIENDKALKLGPITISADTVLVSVFGSLTVVPINTIIMTLFRKHRPKEWPAEDEVIGVDGKRIKVRRDAVAANAKTRWWKKKYPLPYWCAYVAWLLAILCSLTGMLFIILYSLQWGKEKAEAWLSSLILSTVESVVLVQPIKVVALAAILALIVKALDDDEDDVAHRYQNSIASHDEELTNEHLIELNNLVKREAPDPPEGEILAEIRERRKYEQTLAGMIQDSTLYFLFILLICFIVWGTRNPIVFHSNKTLLSEMSGGVQSYFLTKVSDISKFWTWSRSFLIDNLFYMEHYNGMPGTPRDRQYLGDGVNFRVGPLVMRQVRVNPGSCAVTSEYRSDDVPCVNKYSYLNEDTRNFTLRWQPDNGDNDTELTPVEGAFKYKSFTELKNIPFWGRFATYGGGGYVANLGITKGQASALLDELRENDWLDGYTSAVFVEFTIYNPNINVFAYVSLVAESLGFGTLLTSAKVSSFKLSTQLSGMSLFVVASQVAYMILISYFMIRESFKFRHLGMNYWKDVWSCVEVTVICLSWATLAIYLIREAVGRLVLNTLMKNKEQYTNFALFAYYDEVLSYIIGLIAFLAIIKFLRLLRFNKHIAQFFGTLHRAGKDLRSFILMFSLIFIAFANWGYLLLSEYEEKYNTIVKVIETLFSMLIGKFDGSSLTNSHRILGPLYFSAFSIFIYFILLNMFLAILGNAYEEVRDNPELASDEYKVIDFIIYKFKDYIGLSRGRRVSNAPGYMTPVQLLMRHIDAFDRTITDHCREMLHYDRGLRDY